MNRLEIYIHIPFCVKKCDYCDFLSAPADIMTMNAYVKSLKNEIELSSSKMREYLIDTVFIGGGTPSILDKSLISDILETLKTNCNMAEKAEITIECNPGTVTKEKLLCYKKSGINRLSFGLQSTNDKELQSIGRIHSYAQFLESYYQARSCGFDNINIDLMSAIPRQNEVSYKETLEKVIGLNPEHISAYSLIVEEGTKLYKRVEGAKVKGDSILPNEDVERKMYYMTKTLLGKAGYERYEISNYAKKGMECEHNIGYWRGKEYLGFGIGAASLYKGERYSNISDLKQYISKLSYEKIKAISHDNLKKEILGSIEENYQKLTIQEQMEEYMFLGLRMMDGVSIELFEKRFNAEYEDVYGKVLEKLLNQGLLTKNGDVIKLTERGIDLSNYVMSEFLF